MLVVCAALLVGGIAWDLWLLGPVRSGLEQDPRSVLEPWEQYADSSTHLATRTWVGIAVTGVVWAVWQLRVADLVPSSEQTGSPERQVAWWFLPVVNLWRPPLVLRELWRALATGQPAGTVAAVPPGWRAWWVAWVAAFVVWLGSVAVLLGDPDPVRAERWGTWGSVAHGAVLVLAAGLAVRVVLAMTASARRHAEAAVRTDARSAATAVPRS